MYSEREKIKRRGDLWDNNKIQKTITFVTFGVPSKEEKESGTEGVLEEIMAENFYPTTAGYPSKTDC